MEGLTAGDWLVIYFDFSAIIFILSTFGIESSIGGLKIPGAVSIELACFLKYLHGQKSLLLVHSLSEKTTPGQKNGSLNIQGFAQSNKIKIPEI